MRIRDLTLFTGICLILATNMVQAATATFDSLAEGGVGYTFTEGGITFSNFDNYLSFWNPQFHIEDASTGLVGSKFSPNNALGFGSPASGGSTAYSRFGSLSMAVNGVATIGSLDIFSTASSRGNILTLNAYYGGNLVKSESVYTSGFDNYANLRYQYTLGIDGIQFDELRLVSSGYYQGGATFLLIDNVVMTTPIPPAGVLLASGLLLLGAKRRKNASTQPQTAK
jgi:hypothetical protein